MRALSHEEVPESDMSDQGAAFLSAFKGDAKEAFSRLVELYNDEGTRYATRLCHGDVHTAEDVLQEAWFNVFTGCMTFDENHAFYPWFERVIKHAFLDHRRRERSLKRRATIVPLLTSIVDPCCTPALTDLRNGVRESLASLPDDVRHLLERRYIMEESAEDIAREEGLAKKSIYSRLHVARSKAQRALAAVLL